MEAPNGNTPKGQLRYAPSFTQGNVPSGSLPERLRHIPIPLKLRHAPSFVQGNAPAAATAAGLYSAATLGKFLGISAKAQWCR